MARKIRTVDTAMAIDLLTRYLQPLDRNPPEQQHFTVELDEVVRLLCPDVEEWKWSIDMPQLVVAIRAQLSPVAPIMIDVSDWDAGVGDKYMSGYSITIKDLA